MQEDVAAPADLRICEGNQEEKVTPLTARGEGARATVSLRHRQNLDMLNGCSGEMPAADISNFTVSPPTVAISIK
jgi:hypothetical protein